MFKKILLLIFVAAIYLTYARFVLNPQTLNNFSLIDDGQLIKYGHYLKGCFIDHDCISFKTQIIDTLPDIGLSRAGAWLIHGLLYQGSWINAAFQHSLRVYGIGMIMVLLLVMAGMSAGANSLAILLGVAIFVTNYSFTENIVRLGPIEPYMVIFLGIFSLLFLNLNRFSKKWRLTALVFTLFTLIYFLLIKEASIAILPAILVTGLLYPEIVRRRTLIATVVFSGAIYLLVKYLLRGPDTGSTYALNYDINLLFVIKNSWNYINLLISSLGTFFSLLAITPFLFIFKEFRQKIVDKHLIYWILTFIFFMAILFPWKFVFDRYLLPATFTFSIFAMILIGRFINWLESVVRPAGHLKLIFFGFIILILSNIFFTGASRNFAETLNYRNWFGVFTQFESDQVRGIAKMNGTVYINAGDTIDNWEVAYEIPMHINYFYGGSPEVKILDNTMPRAGYLFTRSLLNPVISSDILSKNKYRLVDAKQYKVTQIDTSLFAKSFILRPIQIVLNPPLIEKDINFYWEIRKL